MELRPTVEKGCHTSWNRSEEYRHRPDTSLVNLCSHSCEERPPFFSSSANKHLSHLIKPKLPCYIYKIAKSHGMLILRKVGVAHRRRIRASHNLYNTNRHGLIQSLSEPPKTRRQRDKHTFLAQIYRPPVSFSASKCRPRAQCRQRETRWFVVATAPRSHPCPRSVPSKPVRTRIDRVLSCH